ncbi:MAG: ACT domain-containing protein [Bacillota bacterium]
MKAIITVVGHDKVGIIAGVSGILAEANVNILDINQTVLQEYFTMMMLVDMSDMKISLGELNETLKNKGDELGMSIRVQHEDIFKSMHQI